MRILIVMSSLGGGGAERMASYLASHWAEQGHAVALAAFDSGHGESYGAHPSVEVMRIGADKPSASPLEAMVNNLSKVGALRRAIGAFEPDTCLAMVTANNVLLGLARLGLGRRVRAVGSERCSPARTPTNWWWSGGRRTVYGLLDGLVAQTEGAAQWVRSNTAQNNVPVIPNFVKWPLPATRPSLSPADHLAPESKLLLGVGRLADQKNWPAAIEAFGRICRQHPAWRLVILGEGDQRGELESLIATKALGDRVFLPGRAGNLGDWYERADLMVLTSHYEGFPNVLVEAMSHGLPAVSVDCPEGPADIIRHQTDGLLTPQNAPEQLAGALDELMGDETKRAAFARRAVEVRERFSAEMILPLWDQAVLGS